MKFRTLSYDENSCEIEFKYCVLENSKEFDEERIKNYDNEDYDPFKNDENAVLVEKSFVRSFWAPSDGGYVYDVTHRGGTLGDQVCSGLKNQGSTLCWEGPKSVKFVDLIRKHAKIG